MPVELPEFLRRAQPCILESGIDYLTVSGKPGWQTQEIRARIDAVIVGEAAAGNEVSEWRGGGYRGKRCGGVSFGIREDGCLARLSSGLADEFWKDLIPVCNHCTRIDLQTTVKFKCDASRVLQYHWREAKRHASSRPGLQKAQLRSSMDGPQTIELGSRQSAQFGRIYDKGVESKLDSYKNAVRYELELKGFKSNQVATGLAYRGRPLPAIGGFIRSFLEKRGISAGVIQEGAFDCNRPARHTNATEKLRWLRNGVRGTVQHLIAAGFQREVSEALGLTVPDVEEHETFTDSDGPRVIEGGSYDN